MITRILITSTKRIGAGQTLKDSITPTEKKIILQMLNSGITKGKVRNKHFHIQKTGDNTAEVAIGTVSYSIILGRDEMVTQRVQIKFS